MDSKLPPSCANAKSPSIGGRLYWLIPPGSAADWDLPWVRVLGRGCHVAIPPLHRVARAGLYWQIPPSRDHEWTNTPRLHSALRTALLREKAPTL